MFPVYNLSIIKTITKKCQITDNFYQEIVTSALVFQNLKPQLCTSFCV